MRVHGELLTPTLGEHRPRDWSGPRLPFRVSSQVYVALVGGPVALTIVGLLNAPRLRLDRRSTVLMALAGLVATLAGTAAAAFVRGDVAPRLFLQIAGVLAFGAFHLLQRTPERVHTMFSPNRDPDEDHASLWGPGIAAIVAGWLVQLPLVAALEEAA